MIQVIRSAERHFSDFGWLKTFWLFSFSDYHDPENMHFGTLRVFNDDVVEAGEGFPTHPHDEMEIVTIVLEGEMTHEDSMGNRAVIRAGDVQRMSAGTGLTHSEFNLSDRPVHFYQVWIIPDRRRLTPSCDQKSFDPAAFRNRLVPVASGQRLPEVVTFHTDATIYRADLNKGRVVDHKVRGESRGVFMYVTEGEIAVGGETLRGGDQGRISPAHEVRITAVQPSKFVLIDVRV